MEKMTGETLNITDENIKVIAEHFPEAMEEGKIKFDVLKELLGQFVDEANERYQFTWNGKSQALKLSQTPSTGTLLPCKEKSKDWDTTENLYIEGDNLEVLKLLQKSYYKKIKMIYIDPPYNTGNDFVYKDDFADNIKNYKEITKQECKANPETQGRYHTDWLNMMYPRIRLAKNLLIEDGILVIHIDDNEEANTKKILEEAFGNDNVEEVVWKKIDPKYDRNTNAKVVKTTKRIHEYILIAYKNRDNTLLGKVKKMPQWLNKYTNPDDDPRGPYKQGIISFHEGHEKEDKTSENYYTITTPSGRKITRYFFISKDQFEKYNLDNRIYFPNNGDGVPALKIFENEEKDFYFETILEGMGSMGSAKKEIAELFGVDEKTVLFDTPKPVKLVKEIIRGICTEKDQYVLDFFSGSATLGQAIMELNNEEKKALKYILVQLPVKLEEDHDAYKLGYQDICEVAQQRIVKACNLYDKENDLGFKVFKLDSSNLKLWNGEFNTEEEANNYFLEHLSPLVDGRTNEDLLYELLLKEGMPLTSPIEEIKVEDKTIYSIGMGYLMICLEDKIDMNLVEEIGKRKPESIIFRDSGFADENAKINTIQELKKYGIAEEVIKSI